VIELAVFLGNPGNQYSQTRHNAARMLLNVLPGSSDLPWREKFHGRVCDYKTNIGQCRFLAPETFMNLSGKSAAAALNFYKIDIEKTLIIHDDLELPFGQFAWKTGGGLAGNNGLKSIRDSLGSAGFRRLRLGIGRPTRGSVQSWVLGRFEPDEEAILPLILERAAGELIDILNLSESGNISTDPVRVYPAV
jgi:PTH1 family peptidyl-tRNA hydrolase